MSDPAEIREALKDVAERIIPESEWWAGWTQYITICDAARAYADLLENGQEMEATRVGHKWGSALLKPGRYLVVLVEDDA